MSSAQREVDWRAVGGDGVQLDVTEAGDELSNLCGFAEVLLELEVDAGHLQPAGRRRRRTGSACAAQTRRSGR